MAFLYFLSHYTSQQVYYQIFYISSIFVLQFLYIYSKFIFLKTYISSKFCFKYCSSQEKQTQKMFFLFFFFQKWTLATLLTIIYFQKQTYSIFFTHLPFQKQTHLWNMPVYGASANSSFRLHSLILKSIYSSSFIQPLIDSLTGQLRFIKIAIFQELVMIRFFITTALTISYL